MNAQEIVDKALELYAKQEYERVALGTHAYFAKTLPALVEILDGANITKTAKAHGVGLATIHRHMQMLGLSRPRGVKSLNSLAKKISRQNRKARLDAIVQCAEKNNCESCRYIIRRLEKHKRDVNFQ